MRRRKERRISERERRKMVEDLEKLASLQPGGTPDRPIVVDSPAIVDLRAVASPCPLCEGSLKLEQHTSEEIDGVRLRVASVACTLCGVPRRRYFRLQSTTLH